MPGAGVQGELRITNDDCFVYSSISTDSILTTPANARLWLPKGTKVRAGRGLLLLAARTLPF